MRQQRTHQDLFKEQRQYARVEWIILDLQLGISGVSRANGCLDLGTVRQIRAGAAETLRSAQEVLARFPAEPAQAQRIADRCRLLERLLGEPAPIERLARRLHVG